MVRAQDGATEAEEIHKRATQTKETTVENRKKVQEMLGEIRERLEKALEDAKVVEQSGRTHRREMPSGSRRKGSGKADGCGRGPGLDRSDGSFRVLGVLFVLGDYRPFAGGRGGLSSPAESRFRRIVQTSAQPCEYLPGTDG